VTGGPSGTSTLRDATPTTTWIVLCDANSTTNFVCSQCRKEFVEELVRSAKSFIVKT
jgi:hypothetical protein